MLPAGHIPVAPAVGSAKQEKEVQRTASGGGTPPGHGSGGGALSEVHHYEPASELRHGVSVGQQIKNTVVGYMTRVWYNTTQCGGKGSAHLARMPRKNRSISSLSVGVQRVGAVGLADEMPCWAYYVFL